MKKVTTGIIIFVFMLLIGAISLGLFLFTDEEDGTLPPPNSIKFQEQVNDKSISAAQVSFDEAAWAWRASNGVLDNFIDNYDESIVSKEE